MGVELLYSLIVVFVVIFAGLMSGLTLGLMSQDIMDLKVLERSGTETEKRYAKRILPVVQNPHYTLVTLLLCNAFAVEALPLFLDRLVHEITAIVLSVTVVLIFGEVVPQALCCRYGLMIGAYSAGFVMFLRTITFPVSWPISKLLDWVMGASHTAIFKRPELKALVSLHSKVEDLGGMLSQDEVNVILGAIDMQTKRVEKAMTPLEKVFMLSEEEILDQETINRIVKTGHSRIPIHTPKGKSDIQGLILVKELVMVDTSKKTKVKDLTVRSILYIPANTPMYDVLNLFKLGRSHMAIVTVDSDAGGSMHGYRTVETLMELDPIGIVTIEDLIEELLQVEIVDETDRFVDNLQTSQVNDREMISSLQPNVKRLLGQFTPASLEGRPSWTSLQRIASIAREEQQNASIPLLPKNSQP